MSENSSKNSKNSKVYENSLINFRHELSKLNKKLESDITEVNTTLAAKADNFMVKLEKKVNNPWQSEE